MACQITPSATHNPSRVTHNPSRVTPLSLCPSVLIKLLAVLIALLFLSPLSAVTLNVSPDYPNPLRLECGATDLRLDPFFPRPEKMTIVLWPDQATASHFLISWSPVAGATHYKVFSARAVPDSTFLIPVFEMYLRPDTAENVCIYLYSRHPTYGDPYMQKLGADGAMTASMWSELLLTPWQEDTAGEFSGSTYLRPNTGERDMFFCVRAYRN